MPVQTTLTFIDVVVLVLFGAGITALGLYFTRLQRTTKDYFLGGKEIPWWAVMLSIVAAETSAATFIAAPAYAYAPEGGSLVFLQITAGYLVARILIAHIFVPALRKKEYFSVYNFLEDRFGPSARSIAGLAFFLTRALATGIRIYIPAIVIQQMVPAFSFDICVLLSVGIALLYTTFGGFRAVVWTDFLMFGIYLIGGLLAIFTVLHYVSIGEVIESASAANKFKVLDFNIFSLTTTYTVLSGFVGGTFLSMATHGTDQALAQRLLACRTKKESQKAIIGSGIIIIPQFLFFLFLGVMLYAFYAKVGLPDIAKASDVFPYFIVTTMPHGVIGILLAAILAASMSTTCNDMNALANISVNDFYRRIFHREAQEKEILLVSKIMTVVWGILLIFIAYLPRLLEDWPLLDICLAVPSLFYGSLLGVFLLGFLTKRARETGVIIGAVIGFVAVFFVAIPPLLGKLFPDIMPQFFQTYPQIAWPWFCPVGTVTTMVFGYLLSLLLPGGKHEPAVEEQEPKAPVVQQ